MTVLYICVRYIGILYSVINVLLNLPITITDVVCILHRCLPFPFNYLLLSYIGVSGILRWLVSSRK
jgi:hypothetical protein